MSRLAIIGAGIAGLGSAHFLHQHHELTIFEANNHVGGPSLAVDATDADGLGSAPVDPDFIVYNEANSPLLTRLFTRLEVPVKAAAMTLSVRDDLTGLEWNNASLSHLFARRKNLRSLRFLRLLTAIHRFNKDAVAALDDPLAEGMTLGDYVHRQGYGEDVFNLHLVPVANTVWNASPEALLSFPAAIFLRCFHDHGLLSLLPRQPWLGVEGGARACHERLIAPFRGRIQLGRPVVRIIRNGPTRGVTVMTADGATHAFDRVVVATRADQALRLLVNPTPDEARLLRAFKYEAGTVTLHTDDSVLPRTPLARAVRNHQITRDTSGRLRSSLHYWIEKLQGSDAPRDTNHFVSIDRPEAIDPAKIIKQIDRAHPLFTPESVRAQAGLAALNAQAGGRTETYFVGGYFRHGHHEDALLSAVQLGELLLGRDPWIVGSAG